MLIGLLHRAGQGEVMVGIVHVWPGLLALSVGSASLVAGPGGVLGVVRCR